MPHGCHAIATVTAFDDHVGVGRVVTESGSEHSFHCVSIADGSRTIDVGRVVEVDLVARLGRWEAQRLRDR
jgi:cold shock CspA family protein